MKSTATTKTKPEKTVDGFTIIYSHEQIPDFANETEEAKFWDTHTWSEEQRQKAKEDVDAPPIRTEQKMKGVYIKFYASDLERYHKLATIKDIPYQTLIKQFASERLYEEEKREGLLP